MRSLRELPARDIVRAVADAGARWTDADFPARVRATQAVMARTRYSEPVVDYALDRLFGGITRAALEATIAGELGAVDALDGFIERPGRPAVFYRGAERVAIVASDTTIGVAIPPLAFALCAKTHVLVKDRADRLVAAFAETLLEELPEVAASLAIEAWEGDDAQASRAHLERAGVVVAFGGESALGAIRARLSAEARFIPFGHRTSAGYVAREDLAQEAAARTIAAAAARDALLYDGDGCLSLHMLFVERGGAVDAARFAHAVAQACDAAAIEFPRGAAEPHPQTVGYRDRAFFHTTQSHGTVHSDPAAAHVVAFDPPRHEPPPLLPRALAVYPVDGPADALTFLRAHAVALEAFGCATPPGPALLAMALETGATRIARLGALQDPALAGNHGGESRILPFVRAVYRDPFPPA